MRFTLALIAIFTTLAAAAPVPQGKDCGAYPGSKGNNCARDAAPEPAPIPEPVPEPESVALDERGHGCGGPVVGSGRNCD